MEDSGKGNQSLLNSFSKLFTIELLFLPCKFRDSDEVVTEMYENKMQNIFLRLSREKGCTVESIVGQNIVYGRWNDAEYIQKRYHEYLVDMKLNNFDGYVDLWKFNLRRYTLEEGVTIATLANVMNTTFDKTRRLLDSFKKDGRDLNPCNKPI